MVVGIDPRALDLADGTSLLLDAAAGTLREHPPDAEVDAARARQRERADVHARAIARAAEPASTLDGHRIAVMGNLCHLAEVDDLLRLGGEGVGLLRSEFLAGEGPWVLDEDLQAERYGAIASSLGASHPLTIRTLDVGGDKPLAYLPALCEPNPLLGERGIRFWLARPDLLRAQLRAVLRAASLGAVRVVFPMVALLDEWRAVKGMLEEERTSARCRPRGRRHHGRGPVGGLDGRGLRAGSGLLLDRHQRPGAVHAGDGPLERAPGTAHRRPRARHSQAHRVHGGRAPGGTVGR